MISRPNSQTPNEAAEHIRGVAVRHHDLMVDAFERRYDEMAQDRFASAFSYGRHKIDDLLRAELESLPPSSRVLDVGCGTGNYFSMIGEHGHRPAGVEPADAMRSAAQGAHPDAAIEDGVASSLPFDDESFEFVMAVEVYRYLDPVDIAASYREAHRVLKPGGRFLFTMVNRDALDGFWVLQRVRERGTKGRISDEHPHCEFVTPHQVEQGLERSGFVDARCEGRLFAPIRLAYKISGRAGRATARRLEHLDDRVTSTRYMTRFAGHLICTATKPVA